MRIRRFLITVLALLAAAGPAVAQLHYTLHTELHPVQSNTLVNPALAGMTALLPALMFPEGEGELKYVVSDQGTRVEFAKAYAMMPAGTVIIQQPDATTIVLDPKNQTYWKIPGEMTGARALPAIAAMKPDFKLDRTGELDTLDGLRVEHVKYSATLDLPVPPGAAAPPGMPSTLTMAVDVWASDQFKKYASKGMLNSPVAMMTGLSALGEIGFPVKTVTRISMFPTFEIESRATEMIEGPAPDELFQIPAGYREVAPPMRVPQRAN